MENHGFADKSLAYPYLKKAKSDTTEKHFWSGGNTVDYTQAHGKV